MQTHVDTVSGADNDIQHRLLPAGIAASWLVVLEPFGRHDNLIKKTLGIAVSIARSMELRPKPS